MTNEAFEQKLKLKNRIKEIDDIIADKMFEQKAIDIVEILNI